MPRYSFGSKDKKMPKSPGKSKGMPTPPSSTKKNKNKSKKSKTPSHDKSSPRPHIPSSANRKMSASADAKSSARKTGKKSGNDKDAIPSTILKSKRYGIEVPRTARGEDGFADDSPYWKAAREALTQERGSEQSVGGGGSSSEEDEARKQQQKDQKAAAKAKQKERRRKKLMESEAVYANFQKDQAALKPNFKVGMQGSDDNDGDKARSMNNGDGDSSPEWLKETFRELKSQRKRRGESASNRSGVFSPSELSRASTIPPTPKPASSPESDTKQSPAVDNLVDDHDGENFEMGNDDYDDGLSPIREEVVVKEATKKSDKLIPQEINEPEDSSGEPEELEENIEEVADKLSIDMGIYNNNADGDATKSVVSKNASNEHDIDEQPSFNQQDDYSDGGDDEHGGFELNNDPVSSPSPPTRRSLPTRLSRSQDRIETPLLNNADDHSSNSSQSDSSQDTDKRRKKRKQEKKTLIQKETSQQNKPKKKRGRPRKVTINTAFNTGYPAGNREYTTIPATQYEIDQNEDGNVRRSRRRKFPPLAYWKNEKIVYEANREEGPMAEVFGDMPMVSGIQQAQPTPYKKREPKRRTYASDEDENNDGKQRPYNMKKAEEIKPFDSKKLRKVRIFFFAIDCTSLKHLILTHFILLIEI